MMCTELYNLYIFNAAGMYVMNSCWIILSVPAAGQITCSNVIISDILSFFFFRKYTVIEHLWKSLVSDILLTNLFRS